jgi:hypothetical protein
MFGDDCGGPLGSDERRRRLAGWRKGCDYMLRVRVVACWGSVVVWGAEYVDDFRDGE